MIEVRKISDTPILGISLFVVFYNGVCKPIYARNGKEAEEKVRTIVEKEGYNMSNYAECPYCGKKQEIDNDGCSYDEGNIYQQECAGCGKNFAYVTTVSIFHEAFAAPCMNGDAGHDWRVTKTFPRCYRKLRCSICGEEKEIEGVEEERKAHLAELHKRTGARA